MMSSDGQNNLLNNPRLFDIRRGDAPSLAPLFSQLNQPSATTASLNLESMINPNPLVSLFVSNPDLVSNYLSSLTNLNMLQQNVNLSNIASQFPVLLPLALRLSQQQNVPTSMPSTQDLMSQLLLQQIQQQQQPLPAAAQEEPAQQQDFLAQLRASMLQQQISQLNNNNNMPTTSATTATTTIHAPVAMKQMMPPPQSALAPQDRKRTSSVNHKSVEQDFRKRAMSDTRHCRPKPKRASPPTLFELITGCDVPEERQPDMSGFMRGLGHKLESILLEELNAEENDSNHSRESVDAVVPRSPPSEMDAALSPLTMEKALAILDSIGPLSPIKEAALLSPTGSDRSAFKPVSSADCGHSSDEDSDSLGWKSTSSSPIASPTTMKDILTRAVESQSPSTARSFTIEGKERYPPMWRGTLAMKAAEATVQLYMLAGNSDFVSKCLNPDVSPVIRINQRMRIDRTQMNSVVTKMQSPETSACMICLPCGMSREEVTSHHRVIQTAFIDYFTNKMAAGIANMVEPTSGTRFLVHVFPPGEFPATYINFYSPELYQVLMSKDAKFLFVVLTPEDATSPGATAPAVV